MSGIELRMRVPSNTEPRTRRNLLAALLFGLLGTALLTRLAGAQQYTLTDLGTLGGTYSFGLGINASGQVTGYATTAAGDFHAFLYRNGAMQDLGTVGGTSSDGYGINNFGQVSGQYGLASAGIVRAELSTVTPAASARPAVPRQAGSG